MTGSPWARYRLWFASRFYPVREETVFYRARPPARGSVLSSLRV